MSLPETTKRILRTDAGLALLGVAMIAMDMTVPGLITLAVALVLAVAAVAVRNDEFSTRLRTAGQGSGPAGRAADE